MMSHYKDKVEKGACWCSFKTCPLGKDFLETLYSWSEANPLHPYLAWKVCEPCDNGEQITDNWEQYI
jgi:hypothetical protein